MWIYIRPKRRSSLKMNNRSGKSWWRQPAKRWPNRALSQQSTSMWRALSTSRSIILSRRLPLIKLPVCRWMPAIIRLNPLPIRNRSSTGPSSIRILRKIVLLSARTRIWQMPCCQTYQNLWPMSVKRLRRTLLQVCLMMCLIPAISIKGNISSHRWSPVWLWSISIVPMSASSSTNISRIYVNRKAPPNRCFSRK